MMVKVEFELFKVKTIDGHGTIRAEWHPDNTSRLYSGCGDTPKEALHSVVNLLLEDDIIVGSKQ